MARIAIVGCFIALIALVGCAETSDDERAADYAKGLAGQVNPRDKPVALDCSKKRNQWRCNVRLDSGRFVSCAVSLSPKEGTCLNGDGPAPRIVRSDE